MVWGSSFSFLFSNNPRSSSNLLLLLLGSGGEEKGKKFLRSSTASSPTRRTLPSPTSTSQMSPTNELIFCNGKSMVQVAGAAGSVGEITHRIRGGAGIRGGSNWFLFLVGTGAVGACLFFLLGKGRKRTRGGEGRERLGETGDNGGEEIQGEGQKRSEGEGRGKRRRSEDGREDQDQGRGKRRKEGEGDEDNKGKEEDKGKGKRKREVNRALVYLKPHVASSKKVVDFVRNFLKDQKISIDSEGDILAEEIERRSLIDSHFMTIAKYAQTLTPNQLAVSDEKKKAFFDAFGYSWERLLREGKVFNGKDAPEQLNISSQELNIKWLEATKNSQCLKLAPGLYVAHLKEEDVFVVNGFYGSMREKYTKQDAQIHYFVVEFDPDELSWKDFRGKVIGATDPSVAHPESLRGVLYRNWKDLGIEFQPDISDNGVHGSAGPLAALRERTVWLGTKPHEDPFGATLTSHGVQRLEGWMMNPIVRLSREGNMMKGPCFDLTEDMDSDDVVGALTREYT